MGKQKKRKKKGAGDIVRNVLLIVCIGIFLFSAFHLFRIYMEYKKGSDEYDSIKDTAVIEPAREETGEETEEPQIQAPQIDFASLQATNPDVVGWLELEAIDISYPIVQGKDNDKYLHYTFEGKKNAAGAIFMEYTNKSDFSDCNTIIYGHNMKNGSMFGQLKKFQREDVYSVSPYLWICTPGGSYRYEIFSYHTTSATGDTYTLFSAPGQEFQQYLEKMKSASEIENDVQVSQNDKIVTLSTCTGNDKTRFVVQAKRLPEVYK